MNALTSIANGSPLGDVRQALNRTLSRVFDVTLYGAVADSDGATSGNGTDNTAAFNAAITAASAKGGLVWVPPGHYRLATAALVVAASNVHVDGTGHLFFDSTDNTTFGRLIFDGGATSGEINNVSVRNVTVSNLAGVAVTGPGYGYDGSACMVTFRGCANFLAENVEAFNSPNYIFSATRSRDGAIRGCYGHDSIADGAHVQDGCQRVVVEGNSFRTVGDDGIGIGYWGATSKDIVVSGNHLSTTGSSGIGVYGATDGLVIEANTIDNTWTCGIKLQPASSLGGASNVISGVRVSDNHLRGAGMRSTTGYARSQDVALPILLVTAAGSVNGTNASGTITDVSITNNTIRNGRSGFIVTDGTGGGSIGLMTVTGNICDGVAATGGGGNASSGGGVSKAPTDTSYPGISVTSVVSQAIVAGNIVRGSVGASVTNAAGVVATANNLTGAVSTVILAETFTKANVTPSTAGPGNTTTGNKPILMAKNSDGSYKGTGGISSNRMVFGSGGSYPAAVADAGVSATDLTISADATENVYLLVGSSLDTSVCTIFRPQAGAMYSRNNAPPEDAYNTNFTAASTGSHTYRLRRTATQAFGYIDGTLVATVNLPTSYPFGTYIGWGIDATSTGATGFTNLSVSTSA